MRTTKRLTAMIIAAALLLTLCPINTLGEAKNALTSENNDINSKSYNYVPPTSGDKTRTSPVWNGGVASSFAGGAGTETAPYKIATAEQLARLASVANNQSQNEMYYILTANIVLNDISDWQSWSIESNSPINHWVSIGEGEYGSYNFSGCFNGNGFRVSGLFGASLFGVTDAAMIMNVGVTESCSTYGGIARVNMGTIRQCYNSGKVGGEQAETVGGIVGTNEGNVIECDNRGTVYGNATVGGVVGSNNGSVSYCDNEYPVSGENNVGGIVGVNSGNACNCTNSGAVNGSYNIGGIIGSGNARLCKNTGTVTGTDAVGGICGRSGYWENTDLCANFGAVNGESFVGGIVGYALGADINQCYNANDVTGISIVGGIVGIINAGGTVATCYSSGSVFGSEGLGGIVGNDEYGIESTQEYSQSCYYLSSDAVGLNEFGIALTSEQMKLESSYQSFDFHNIWTIEQATGYEYPQFMRGMNPIYGEPSAVWDGKAANSFADGKGSEDDPYMIRNAEQLAYLAVSVNSGTSYEGKHIKLAKDIILNNYNAVRWVINATPWVAIGTEDNSFRGTFDGDNHYIGGVYDACVFGENDGTIKNLLLNNLFTLSSAGLIECNMEGDVIECGNIGEVTGMTYVGGVAARTSSYADMGGDMISCYNSGIVSGYEYVGGVAGASFCGKMNRCYNTGTVYGTNNVGGVAGYGGAGLNCNNAGAVQGINAVGGVFGSGDIVEGCYNVGRISGDATVGGVIGCVLEYGNVTDSYNVGTVSGSSAVGGIVGSVEAQGEGDSMKQKDKADSSSAISQCYNAGLVANGSGIVGLYYDGTVSCCYYLDERASGTDSYGAVALTQSQMRDENSYSGFSFTSVWTMDGRTDYPYPELIDNPMMQGLLLRGDVNGDGTLNTGDAVIVLRKSVGLVTFNQEQEELADYNCDGLVNTGDAVGILRYCVGLKAALTDVKEVARR